MRRKLRFMFTYECIFFLHVFYVFILLLLLCQKSERLNSFDLTGQHPASGVARPQLGSRGKRGGRAYCSGNPPQNFLMAHAAARMECHTTKLGRRQVKDAKYKMH
jgi:hypothetical protein